LRKATISFAMSVCLSVRPHGKNRLPLDRLSLNVIREFFENLLEKIRFH
jgi:hypothetical protein